jgi:integrase
MSTDLSTNADATELLKAPLRPELSTAARAYMAEARAQTTRRAYGRAWAAFEAWCAAEGRQALPASPETVAGWMTAMAAGVAGYRSLARSSINQALSAVVLAHHTAGHPLDRKHPVIAETWRGISRTKARTEVLRQAQPIVAVDLRTLLEDLRRGAGHLPADARDAALLALGWAAALRRSELVGLDWQKLGGGSGYVQVDERGVTVTLAQSKGAQTEAATVVVPRADMPVAAEALEQWALVAALKPGEAIFRSIDKGQRIKPKRLGGRSVARIVKMRMRAYAIAAGRTETEAEALAERMSGHSMRSGYATAAAAADVPSYRIQQHTRHKSSDMVARYVREADKWTKSGLKGVY